MIRKKYFAVSKQIEISFLNNTDVIESHFLLCNELIIISTKYLPISISINILVTLICAMYETRKWCKIDVQFKPGCDEIPV